MENNSPAPAKKSPMMLLIVIALIMGVLWLGISNLPRGYSRDLSQIGKGKNIAVLVHDQNLMLSVELMETLNKVRPEFENSVEFVVADLTTPEAQAFATTRNVNSATLVFFAPDGTQRGTLSGMQNLEAIRNSLNQAFGLTAQGNSPAS